MKINDNIGVFVFVTDELIFNEKYDLDFLISIISNEDFPCNTVINQLNQILGDNLNTETSLKKYNELFLNNIEDLKKIFPNINTDLFKQKDYAIISTIGCEILQTMIIKYGKFKKNVITYKVEFLLPLIVIASSILSRTDENKDDKKDLLLALNQMQYYQFSNIDFRSNVSRTFYIYEKYISTNEINELFFKKYNYSIKSYLNFMILITTLNNSNVSYIKKEVLKIIIDEKELPSLIDDLKLNIDDEKHKNEIEIKFQIYPQLLYKKFVLEVDSDTIQIINFKRLVDYTYINFIDKIRKIYDKEKIFSRKYGDLLEMYCRDLANDYVSNAKNKHHKFIDKFKFDSGQKESSDFYVKINDDLLIFEIKSTGRYNETTKQEINYETQNLFKNEIETKIISPANQVDNCLTEMKKHNDTNIEIINAKNIYYIIVSEEVLKNNKKLQAEKLSQIKCNNTNNPIIFLDITEFELLMTSLHNRSKSVVTTLEHYLKAYSTSNFIDFALKENVAFKFNKNRVLDKIKIFDEILEKFKKKQSEI